LQPSVPSTVLSAPSASGATRRCLHDLLPDGPLPLLRPRPVAPRGPCSGVRGCSGGRPRPRAWFSFRRGCRAPLALRGGAGETPHRMRRASHRAGGDRLPLSDLRRRPRRADRDHHRRGRGVHHPPGPASVSGRLLHPRMPCRRSGRTHPLWHALRVPGGEGGAVPGGEAVKLSPHFTLAEVTATRHGENIPSEEDIERLRIVVLHAEVIRAEFSPIHGLAVTSGFRSEEVNRKVGGAPNSAHLYGCALDLVPLNPAVTIEEIWRWLPTSGLLYDQAIWEI